MYDLRRLRGLLLCLVPLLASLTLAGAAIRSVVADVSWLPKGLTSGRASLLQDAGPRIVAAQRSLARGGRPLRLGLMLGSSTLPYSIDPARLALGDDWRWLLLKALGGDGVDVAALGEFAMHAGLRPEVVVLVINPGMLATVPDPVIAGEIPPLAAIRRNFAKRRLKDLISSTEDLIVFPWNRLFPNRGRLSNAAGLFLYASKFALMRRLGGDLGALHAPHPHPWDIDTGDAIPFGTPAVLRIQEEAFRSRGWFDPESIQPGNANTQAIVGLIREARARGSLVVVIFAPERARVRAMEPPDARKAYESAVAQAFGPDVPPLIDVRDFADDSDFIDLVHLDAHGRNQFTVRLSPLLKRELDRGRRPGVAPATRTR